MMIRARRSLLLIILDGVKALKNGKLCDLAPTILELLRVPKPQEMKGKSLI
jgi:2,3-bisphosphoglycerate-independent phosphoglycerate mutase